MVAEAAMNDAMRTRGNQTGPPAGNVRASSRVNRTIGPTRRETPTAMPQTNPSWPGGPPLQFLDEWSSVTSTPD